jgi:3-deoxy-D-manno-octulosonic-acid transferase
MSRLIALVYVLVYSLALPAIVLRLLRSPGSARVWQRFGFGLPESIPECIWLHASSVGEVALLEPLVAALKDDNPRIHLLITAFTATGMATAENRFPEETVYVFPFDYRFSIKRYVRCFNPRLAIVVESEFWPAFLSEMASADIPVAVLNGKMSQRSMTLHSKTRFVAQAIRHVAVLAMQDESNAERIRRLGAISDRVYVTGNMKFDLVASGDRSLTRAELGIPDAAVVIVGGSLHDREDTVLLNAVFSPEPLAGSLVLLLAPRYTESAAAIAQAARQRGLRVITRTEMLESEKSGSEFDVCVVDTLGELRSLYRVADAVFVGGSLFDRGRSRGGHNLMEPAICGVPVLFGPYNYSFAQVATELERTAGGRLVRSSKELRAALAKICADPDFAARMGAAARAVVIAGQGATARNLELIRGLLEPRRY